MVDLKKMFDRITYQGIPTQPHKRSRTELYDHEIPQNNPEPTRTQLPTIQLKPIKTEGNEAPINTRNENRYGVPPFLQRNSLHDIKVERPPMPKRNNPKHFNLN